MSASELSGPDLVAVLPGVYRYARLRMCPTVMVQALLLAHPATAYASHLSAARVYGLPLDLPGREHITVLHPDDRRRRGQVCHHLGSGSDDVRLVGDVRASGPEQLFVELAAHLGLVDLVVAGDALVRWHGLDPQRLRAVVERAPRRVRRLAQRAAGYVRVGVDSPMETRLRMLIVLAGLPEPEVNHTLYRADGRVRFRFDLGYPDLKLAVEYDGRQHRDDLDQWDSDLSRRDWLDAEGWALVPVVARGIYRRPDQTLRRVREALQRAGAADLPRRLSPEWEAHFQVRP